MDTGNWSESNLGSVGVMEALVNITTAHYQDVLLQLLADLLQTEHSRADSTWLGN